jgi:uncharacterized RDD family membrane protein YckC
MAKWQICTLFLLRYLQFTIFLTHLCPSKGGEFIRIFTIYNLQFTLYNLQLTMSSLHHTNIQIQTSQNVTIEYEVGSLGDRYVAGMLDLLVIWTYISIIALIVVYMLDSAISRSIRDLDFGVLFYVLIMIPVAFYHPISEILFNGQSIGKMIMKLKVVRLDGSSLRLSDVLMRWLFRIAEVMISMGGIAIIAIIINGKGQRLGDMAAGTAVVNTKRRVDIDDNLLWLPTQDHQVQFPEVANLTDTDIESIKEIYEESQRIDSIFMVFHLAERLQKVLNITPNMPPRLFVEAVIADYYSIHA